jgi:hypothetical protein
MPTRNICRLFRDLDGLMIEVYFYNQWPLRRLVGGGVAIGVD